MSAPLKAVPDGKRPHPRQLLDSPDPKIRKAAQRVMDAVANLDKVWEDNAAKAELRQREADLKAQLAKVQAELRGEAKQPTKVSYDAKAVRAWAADNGIDVASVGRIPKAVLAQYEDAHAHDGGAA